MGRDPPGKYPPKPAHDAHGAALLDGLSPGREERVLEIILGDLGVVGVARHAVVALDAVSHPVLCGGGGEWAGVGGSAGEPWGRPELHAGCLNPKAYLERDNRLVDAGVLATLEPLRVGRAKGAAHQRVLARALHVSVGKVGGICVRRGMTIGQDRIEVFVHSGRPILAHTGPSAGRG